MAGGYIGHTGASSTVITDIAESIAVSGFVDVSGPSLDSVQTNTSNLEAKLDTLSTNLADVSGAITTTSAVSVNSGSLTAAVSFPASTGITGGGVEAGAQRVTIANNSTGVLHTTIQADTSSYLSHVYIDLDSAGDNPASNTAIVAAPGSGNRLVVYGVQGSMACAGASDYGNWYISDGNLSDSATLWTGRAQGTTAQNFSITFPYGVPLTANTAMKVSSTEGSGNIFINAVVYYRSEAT
jgi:hypothetical protein|tara:strand:+ start:1820 stop:2539 length:720 start_codon:yes stop_codon:yes gene_type:complete